MPDREFAYKELGRERADYIPQHHFNAADQERILDGGRFADGSNYGTNFGPGSSETSVFAQGWNEDAQG